MPRYKPADRSPRPLPVVLSEQIQSGTFEFGLDHLVDHELNLAALDARLNNDETGASAYNPRVMLKVGWRTMGIPSRRAVQAQNDLRGTVQALVVGDRAEMRHTGGMKRLTSTPNSQRLGLMPWAGRNGVFAQPR